MRTVFLLLSLAVLISCNNDSKRTDAPAVIADSKAKTTVESKEIIAAKHPSEDSIVFYLSEIERMRSENDFDNLDNANKALVDYLKRVCQDESILQHELKAVDSAGMNVLTSEDRKFRIYCWDTETGGTMHFYNAIVHIRQIREAISMY